MIRSRPFIDFTITRYNEPNFRRMEPFLLQIIQNYPSPTFIEPVSLAPSTFMLNLRAAISAILDPACPYTTTKLNLSNLERIRTEFSFRLVPNPRGSHPSHHLAIGPPNSNQRPLSPIASPVHSMNTTNQIASLVDANEVELLEAFCLIKARGYLNSELEIENLSEERAADIQQRYPNLTVVPDATRDNVKILF